MIGVVINRSSRAQVAAHTLQILQSGVYLSPFGRRVDLSDSLKQGVAATRVIRPLGWEQIVAQSAALANDQNIPAQIEVTGETTLAAIRRLCADQPGSVAALNFASAKNPGGGFLSGSQAQEESLARSSGLFATLEAAPEYYDANRSAPDTRYTDHAILSPRVPIFRDDDGQLLEQPHFASFITMPAVNAGALKAPLVSQIQTVMKRRIGNVLALAAVNGYRSLVLGAWGCGVFRNDPAMIASLFAEALAENQPWRTKFDRVVFAVFDPSTNGTVLAAFKNCL